MKCDCECHSSNSDTHFCGDCYPLHIGYDEVGKWVQNQNLKYALRILYGQRGDRDKPLFY